MISSYPSETRLWRRFHSYSSSTSTHALTHSPIFLFFPSTTRLGLLYRHCTISLGIWLSRPIPSDLISHNTHHYRVDSSHLISHDSSSSSWYHVTTPHVMSSHPIQCYPTASCIAPKPPRSSRTILDRHISLRSSQLSSITSSHFQSLTITPNHTTACIYLLVPLSHILSCIHTHIAYTPTTHTTYPTNTLLPPPNHSLPQSHRLTPILPSLLPLLLQSLPCPRLPSLPFPSI